jgi:hypothetical protein
VASRFEDILSDCTERLLQGESVEQCLQRYPEQARELEPLLRVAAAARETSTAVEPRPEFRDRTRYEIQSRLRAAEPKAGARKSPMMGWMPRWAVAAVSLVFVILLCGTTTVAASSDALPGDTLYGVKTTAEAVQLRLTFSEEGKARLQARFAQRRAWEMARLAESGRTERLRTLATRFGEHLARIEELAARIEATDPEDGERIAELRETLNASMDRDLALLEKAEAKAPPRAAAAVAVAKFRLTQRYEKAIAALDELENRQGAEAGAIGGPESGAGSEAAGGSGPDGQGGSAGSGQQGTGTGLELKALAA